MACEIGRLPCPIFDLVLASRDPRVRPCAEEGDDGMNRSAFMAVSTRGRVATALRPETEWMPD